MHSNYNNFNENLRRIDELEQEQLRIPSIVREPRKDYKLGRD